MVKLPAEVDPPRLPATLQGLQLDVQCSWAAALTASELPDQGWDATPTAWRRLPSVLYPGVMEQSNPSLVTRDLHVAGCVFHLDESGRPHPSAVLDASMEPLEPDCVINNEAILADLARRTGGELQVCRKPDQISVAALPSIPPTGLPYTPGRLVLALNNQGRLVRTGPS
jgi:hypothetical protein